MMLRRLLRLFSVLRLRMCVWAVLRRLLILILFTCACRRLRRCFGLLSLRIILGVRLIRSILWLGSRVVVRWGVLEFK